MCAYSDSSAEDDPRFRIPRGESDEDIASSEASGYGSGADEAGEGEAAAKGGGGGGGERVGREVLDGVVDRLRRGRGGGDGEGDGEFGSDGEDDEGDGEGEEVGEELLEAATGVKGFGRRVREKGDGSRGGRKGRVVVGEGEEGVLRSGGKGAGHAEVMGRMLGVLEGGAGGGVGDLKKRVGRLAGKGAVGVAAAGVVRERIERKVAFEGVREEVGRWEGVVKENRRKEVLNFPLGEPGGGRGRRSGEIGSGVVGEGVEKEVEEILRQAGVEEEAVEAVEGVAVGREEVESRRAEVRRMRANVFEKDRKLRRIKKIKSRRFRKGIKAEKERAAEEARAAGLGGSEDEAEEAERAERERVEERMTLRHKNTSKWVRRQLTRGEGKRNLETRAAIEEQLRIGEELRRKMERSDVLDGKRRDRDGESESESESESGRDEKDERELEAYRDEMGEDEEGGEGREGGKGRKKQKGLMGLKFMQDAQERRRREAVALLGEMGDDEDGKDDEEEGNDGENVDVGRQVGKGRSGAAFGRRTFSGRAGGAERTPGRGFGGSGDEQGSGVDHEDMEEGVGEEKGAAETRETAVLRKRVLDEYESTPAGMATAIRLDVVAKRKEKNALAAATNGDELDGESGAVGRGYTTTLEGFIGVNVDKEGDDMSARADAGAPRVVHSDALGKNVAVESSRNVPAGVSRKSSVAAVPAAESSAAAENPWLKPVAVNKKRSHARASEVVHELSVPGIASIGAIKGGHGIGGARTVARRAKRVRIDNGSSDVAGDVVGGLDDSITKDRDEEVERGPRSEDSDIARMMVAARAFAGAGGADMADFRATKETEIERSLPTAREIGAEVLPGWGSGWAGAGTQGGKSRHGRGGKASGESAFAKAAREKLEAARASAIAARVDGKHAHVLVTARRAKKAADLTMASVPFPFTSAAQWEQEVAAPLVRERLTAASHAAATRPKVVVPRGEALQPLRMSAGAAAAVAKKRTAKETGRGNAKNDGKGKSGAIERRGRRAQERDQQRRGLLV